MSERGERMSTMTTDTTLAEVDEALSWAWASGDRAYVDRLLDQRLALGQEATC